MANNRRIGLAQDGDIGDVLVKGELLEEGASTGTTADYQTAWASRNAISGGAAGIVPVAGRYFSPGLYSGGLMTMVQSREYIFPFRIEETCTIDRIAVEVTTLAASSVVRFGVRDKNRALLLDAGTADTSTTGVKEVTTSLVLTPGRYHLTAVAQGGTPAVRANNAAMGAIFGHDTASVLASAEMVAYTASGVTGALAATLAIGGQTSSAPRVMFRTV